ncbi:MAG: FAD-binding oxidoreductase [Kordiimonadaceae bacterium]|nr:FAD-binding oxidoreductase [Kordiimonadaceae bacterium]MBO6569983.1 FAD-binding oxidoreductase [Kordiimonadaceae bacterium]MBO6965920.1 FAD-binding oxidoreductase [Kordiimonadaceae bacterium]
MIDQHHLDALGNIVGPKGSVSESADQIPFVTEWRDKFVGKTPLVLQPQSTSEVSQILAYCNRNKISVVPQGGNTGLVGGGIPGLDGSSEILLSTRRMQSIIEVDALGATITAEAGVTVSELQGAAAEKGLLFGLSLASEGSCTAGGVFSTNAGGVHVIRYGTTRDMTLGVEAVLADGSIINELSGLRKDNTGFAISNLFAGAEGTLGIVTKVCFRLFPAERSRSTAWLAVPSPAAALELLSLAKEVSEDQVSVFELMCRQALEFTFRHIDGCRDPLSTQSEWYVLLETASTNADSDNESRKAQILEMALSKGLVSDGALAQSLQQRQDFWRVRESISEAQKLEGGSIKHDISLPLRHLPEFVVEASNALARKFPGCRVTPFGHLGDGNLHFNVMQPANTDKHAFLDQWEPMNQLVHDLVTQYGGSISAEHGIGVLKKNELRRLKPVAELGAMRAIKSALDPNNILNPRCLFD